MHSVAYWALLASLLVSLFGSAVAAMKSWRGEATGAVWFERAQIGVFVLTTVASAVMVLALWKRDFSFQYVAEYTDTFLPLFYAITAFWAGQAGSLLFWMFTLALWGALFARSQAYAALSPDTRRLFWLFYLGVEAFFLLLLTGPSNPFMELVPAPHEGRGLNPLLRNPGMIFHPPLLFLGYAGFTVPCCLALASYLAGERVPWLRAGRNSILLAWVFLTAGIVLGGWWSYMELGWGGYWAWDPVENASLIPWLMGTAFIHTAVVERRRGGLERTNVLLVSLTFLSSIFATYLVRSGVVESLHAFGEGGVSRPLLVFILFGLALTVAALRLGGRPDQESRPLPGLLSLPGFLVVLAWLFTALSLVVIMGTMWPVISTLWSDNPVGLDPGFYNRACNPLFAVAALLLILCPWLAWKGGVRDRGAALWLGVFSLASGVALYFSGMTHPVALAAAVGAIGTLAGVLLLFVRDRAARSRKGGLAGYLVHAGTALLFLGVAVSGPYQSSKEAILAPGSDMNVAGYRLVYRDLAITEGAAQSVAQAVLDVEKDGRKVAELTPERRVYRGYEQPFAEVSTVFSLGDELYAVLLSFTDEKAVSIKISVNPLVNWIWIGGTVMSLAGLVGLSRFRPGRGRGEA
ncbi:heme lyase CcmF/NrfE family subunit [Desulfolutivibrio sulfoxidireducens]|uniref:heme lyase CcmF/NrfE family subunit n=1 Tax=Desulfolutivibrio sulfoxidireducens TaxID=2773299 RepID=UPI00159E7EF4|nr:cytochrome c-type biogenesis CcmF C-terminal domain-containing protein [Desulfolutivibrio sulfoxidireducens]QLA19190.1 heme lyase CcmF/NrfE family subunit [Desulfolutivibrio sulfoxidireducens]